MENELSCIETERKLKESNQKSFLEPEILKYLQREVDHLAIETEFDSKVFILIRLLKNVHQNSI